MPKPSRDRAKAPRPGEIDKLRTTLRTEVTGLIKGSLEQYKASAMYAAARRTRLKQRIGGTAPGSAQWYLDPAYHAAIRADCQAAARDNSVARAFIKRKADLDVGDGPVITSTAEGDWRAQADAFIEKWASGLHPGAPCDARGRCSLPELLRQIDRAWDTDGDVLAMQLKSGEIQLIESARVGAGTLGREPSGIAAGNIYQSGVEMNKQGKPVAYWFADWNTQQSALKPELRRQDADYAELLCNPSDETVGMVRGEPGLQASLDQLDRLDAVIEKTALAVELATLFGLIIKTDRPAETQAAFEATTQQTETDSNKPATVDLEPGGALYLRTGESAEQLKPEHPSANFKEFVTAQLMIIAADLGIPLPASHFDASGMSWSNIKALMALAKRAMEVRQARLERWVRKIYAWRLRLAVEEKMLPAPLSEDAYDQVSVRFPSVPVVDFESEVKGYTLAIEKGLMDYDQATQSLGTGRVHDVHTRLAAQQQTAKTLGLEIVQTPGASVSNQKPAAGQTDPNAAP